MNFKLNLKLGLITGLGLLIPVTGINVSRAHAAAVVTSQPVNQQKEAYWTKRIDQFAQTRAKYHYPSISWNTRDLGGYAAQDGYFVKSDRIFRSSNLHAIKSTGAQEMQQLGINKVIDLRSYAEKSGIKNIPDPNEGDSHSDINLNVQYYNFPTNSAAQHARNSQFKQKYGQIYTYGKPFTDYKSARRSYYHIFQLALHNQNGAFLYHCLAGRDRTGLVSVLLLSALGVNKRTIYNDYMLTNYYTHKYPYVHQRMELDRFYQTIQRSYGSMHNYLRKGIGLTARQNQQLKQMYLTKN